MLLRGFYNTHYKDINTCSQPDQQTKKEASTRRDSVKRRMDFKKARQQSKDSQTSTTAPPKGHRDRMGRRNLSTVTQAVNDELSTYLAEAPVESAEVEKNPIGWWQHNLERFPTLSIIAVDFLSIPSSSAESERSFSSAGQMITPVRNRLRHTIITMAQCLRS